MSDMPHLADVLGRYFDRSGYTSGQLARLSGIPQATIVNWLEGRVKKPREQNDLLKLAAKFHLNATETSELLQSAGYPPMAELLAHAKPDDANLFAPWIEVAQQRLATVPFQAIADLPYFVGREQELVTLKETLLESQRVVICSLQGMGGVGKTALAAHLAYELRSHFPDGVLWARVDTSNPISTLRSFAYAYGHDISAFTDLESCSRVVRDILAHKRALIVLDNVQSSDEVRPLLPPTLSSAVIITTRRHDLAVARGVHRFVLGPFDRNKLESLDLFVRLLGAERTWAERTALLELADLLGHLPLAVAIAAGRLACEPDSSTSDFVRRLQQFEKRLPELANDDESVRLSFNLSYEALQEDRRGLFAALGTFGEEFSIEAVAYVGQLSVAEARDRLHELHQLSLIEHGRNQRYRLHPLLRDYARERIPHDDVFRRMIEYFVDYVERHESDNAAIALEISNIVTGLEAAFTHPLPPALVQRVTQLLDRYLAGAGQRDYVLAEEHLTQARRAGDHQRLIVRLTDLGALALARGNTAVAEQLLQEAITLSLETGHHALLTLSFRNLGESLVKRGDYARAEACLRDGLAQARAQGHPWGVGIILETLGDLLLKQGQLTQAFETFAELHQAAGQLPDQVLAASALYGLARVSAARGDFDAAHHYGQQSQCLFEAFRHPHTAEVAQWLAALRPATLILVDEASPRLSDSELQQRVACDGLSRLDN